MLQIFPKSTKNVLILLCLGVHLQLRPINYPPPNFFSALVGVHVHPVHPLATPGLMVGRCAVSLSEGPVKLLSTKRPKLLDLSVAF